MAKGWASKPTGTRWACNHGKLPGMAVGWLVCEYLCGWAGVCRACLVEAGLIVPQEVPWAVCSRHWAKVETGQCKCVDGYVVPVEACEMAGGELAEE